MVLYDMDVCIRDLVNNEAVSFLKIGVFIW